MRVVVADDHLLVREGVAHVVRDAGHEIVAEVGDAVALLRVVRETAPDMVIADIKMPPSHTDEGLVAAELIRSEHPTTGVLVLSQYVEPEFALRLLAAEHSGVGYLLKDHVFSANMLIDAINRVHDGNVVVDPALVAELFARQRRRSPLDALTDREREVLSAVAEGLSNRAIAQQLHIAERTVEAHVTQVMLKFGLAEQPDTHRRVLAVLAFLRC